MINNRSFFAVAVIFSFFLLLFPVTSEPTQQRQGPVIQFGTAQWQKYKNEQQGYSIMLPPELKTNFTKTRDREEAAQSLLPFDYVNFGPKISGNDQEPFELGLGVHWNKYNMTTRAFADLKDVGVKKGVRQYVTLRSTAVTVADIEGVRDDFALEKEYGWTAYSRVIIPFEDKFFVFLCTVGSDTAVAEYERVFHEIIDSFKILKRRAL